MLPVDLSLFGRFVPMNALAASARAQIARTARLVPLTAGQELDLRSLPDTQALYLVEGEVLLDPDGEARQIKADTPRARLALVRRDGPRPLLRAATAAGLLQVDRHLVSTCMVWTGSAADPDPEQTAALTPELLEIGLLRRIPAASLLRIGMLLDRLDVGAGDVVIRQGDSGDYYYLVRSGEFEVSRRSSPEASPVTLALLRTGDSFGEEALVSETPRNATVTARGTGILLRLTKANFLELIRDPLLRYVDRAEAERLVATGARWLDVRLPEEFAVDGPEGGLNIPLGELRSRIAELDRDASYVVCCSSGRRSAAGAFLLTERGFSALALVRGLRAKSSPRDTAGETDKLPSELARANAEVELRLHERASAQAATSHPTAGVAPGTHTLDEQLEQAATALARAQRRKLEIESRLRETEAAAHARQRETDEACERLRSQTDDRLRAEEERLQTEYARASHEMEKLRAARGAAEQRFDAERAKLDERLARSRETLQNRAQQVREGVVEVKQQAGARSDQIRAEFQAAEEQLRHQTEARLQSERERLEAALRESMAEQENARLTLIEMDNARAAAQGEARQLAAQLETEAEARRAVEEQALQSEQAELASRYARASDAMAKAQANTARSDTGGAELPLSPSDPALDEAREELLSAEQARTTMARRIATRDTVEHELRVQLSSEAEEWIVEERARAQRELAKAQREAQELERIERGKAETRRKARQVTESILSEVSDQLGEASEQGTAENITERMIRLRAAEEKTVLTAAALDRNAIEKATAEAALERMRARVRSLDGDPRTED